MVSYRSVASMLSNSMVMRYSTANPITNKFARTNSIFQHNYVTDEYSDSRTDGVTFF